MRRSSLVLVTLALCLAASACSSTTGPRRGEWMPDGTWCTGYISPTGLCVEDGDGD
jgi:hypothetical protein